MSERDIEAMRARIAAASSERDRHRRDGPEASYLQAYVVVKALELALDDLLAQSRPHRGPRR
jgi:hypothetical protein